ncbi:unnamed protein product [Nezara viridula]|uniref:Uncharacterized protein n=1 Tax=Nezara viridula TaxID=85310 RepID=A0A9P0HG79_NEZVI|nr:unnamed protein product [Nezara viridula]
MKLNHTVCSTHHVTMTDSNYQQIFNYFRHCYYLTQALMFEDRKPYLERMNELLQETWYDFIWRTDLSSELLVKMQAAKENLLKQSLEDISYISMQVSRMTKERNVSDRTLILLCTFFILMFFIVAIIIKFAISPNLKSPSYSEQCTSEIDVRRMNVEPPKISPSSSEGHMVYYETHFLTCIGDRKKGECSIPSQIHIKMCCSHEACNRNPEIVMQKCKIHDRTSETELSYVPSHNGQTSIGLRMQEGE